MVDHDKFDAINIKLKILTTCFVFKKLIRIMFFIFKAKKIFNFFQNKFIYVSTFLYLNQKPDIQIETNMSSYAIDQV